MAAVVLQDGRLVAVGGFNNDVRAPLAVVEIFDPETMVWSSLPPLPVATAGLAAAVLQDGRLVAVGGYVAPRPFHIVASVFYLQGSAVSVTTQSPIIVGAVATSSSPATTA